MMPNSSLLKWLATFKLDNKPSIELKNDAYYNLADGYLCARILNQISPQYFTDQWLDGIKPVPTNGSWRLRVSNLKRILLKIHDYSSDLQSPQFKLDAITPDVAVIAQNFDSDQIGRLIQLILFCAINCDKKQEYIEIIRNQPTQVKQDIKEAIEELLIKNENNLESNTSHAGNESKNNDSVDNNTTSSSQKLNLSQGAIASPTRSSSQAFRRDLSKTSFDSQKKNVSYLERMSFGASDDGLTLDEVRQRLNTALILNDEKAQTCHEMELRLEQLRLEKEQLAFENEKLSNEKISSRLSSTPINNKHNQISSSGDSRVTESRLNELDNNDTKSLAVQQKLHSEVYRLKEELIRLETEKEEFRLKSELLEEDLNKIASQHDQLRYKAEQAKRLQDELDEYKQMTEKVVNYESSVENLMKKNNELKKELKSLEVKNLSHIRKIVSLEEENSQLAITISQVDIYKKQLHDAQVRLSQETHRADKAEVDLTRLTEKYLAAKSENQRLFETTNQLIRSASKDAQDSSNFVLKISGQSRELESVNLKQTSDQSKNSVGQDSGQEQEVNLSSMSPTMQELRERIAKLEIENGILQTKVNTRREADHSVLGGLLENANANYAKLEVENRQSRKRIMLLEGRLKDAMTLHNGASTSSEVHNETSSDNTSALINRVEELHRLLFQKEQELRESELKYKKNLQKAKDVIKSLNNNQSLSGSLHPSCISSSSFNSGSLDETNILRQLKEREERLIELEREYSEYRKLKEIHERLIMSAFYGLSTTMQWKNAENRLEKHTLTSLPNTATSSMNLNKHSH